MSPDLAPIENVWQLLKMKLRKRNYQSLICAIERIWKSLPSDLATTLVHSKFLTALSDGDFILRC